MLADEKTAEEFRLIKDNKSNPSLDFTDLKTVSILDQAKLLVDKGRQDQYGSPERNINMIADLWSTYLDTVVTDNDVCNLMSLLKIARLRDNPTHLDSDVDLVGYTYLKHVIREARSAK